jgi:putative hydrolase of the HAD superfamily
VSASDGLVAEFAGEGAELAAIRDYLPRFRAEAFADGLLERWQRVRFASQGRYPGAAELLAELRSRGVRLALVTNGTSDLQRRKLAVAGLDEYFDAVVASCDIGIGKPDPAIFAAALDALGVGASEAVMVGNDRERDIEGAAAAGIRAHWVQPGRTELRRLPELLGF